VFDADARIRQHRLARRVHVHQAFDVALVIVMLVSIFAEIFDMPLRT
jgi:hypothetical protein